MILENRKNCFSHEEQHDQSRKSCGRYRYRAFGLHIASYILLPEPLTVIGAPNTPEVSIRYGKVPAAITGAIERTESYQGGKESISLPDPRGGPLLRDQWLVAADMDGEKVILNIEKGKYFGLNCIDSRIWELIETIRGKQSADWPQRLQTCRPELAAEIRNIGARGDEQEYINVAKSFALLH